MPRRPLIINLTTDLITFVPSQSSFGLKCTDLVDVVECRLPVIGGKLTFFCQFSDSNGAVTTCSPPNERVSWGKPAVGILCSTMFCILGPEMSLGDPQFAGRSLRSRFSSNKLKDSIQCIPQKRDQSGHRSLGSIISSNCDSVRSSVRRATSVRVTKRERKIVRAHDIFSSNSDRYVASIASSF